MHTKIHFSTILTTVVDDSQGIQIVLPRWIMGCILNRSQRLEDPPCSDWKHCTPHVEECKASEALCQSGQLKQRELTSSSVLSFIVDFRQALN